MNKSNKRRSKRFTLKSRSLKPRKNWDTVKNYFHFRVTSALLEGVNKIIKSLKRQVFGYRNMDYSGSRTCKWEYHTNLTDFLQFRQKHHTEYTRLE